MWPFVTFRFDAILAPYASASGFRLPEPWTKSTLPVVIEHSPSRQGALLERGSRGRDVRTQSPPVASRPRRARRREGG